MTSILSANIILCLGVKPRPHCRLGTTACESISAAANVFLGMVRQLPLPEVLTCSFRTTVIVFQTEAPLTIKPYMNLLTLSELFAVRPEEL